MLQEIHEEEKLGEVLALQHTKNEVEVPSDEEDDKDPHKTTFVLSCDNDSAAEVFSVSAADASFD